MIDYIKLKKRIGDLRESIHDNHDIMLIKDRFEAVVSEGDKFKIIVDRCYPEDSELPADLELEFDKIRVLKKKFKENFTNGVCLDCVNMCSELEDCYSVIANRLLE